MNQTVEVNVKAHLESIRLANQFETLEKTYEFVIENWYMYDAFWLQIVCHMKNTGRLQ
jgi:hypothetical protein